MYMFGKLYGRADQHYEFSFQADNGIFCELRKLIVIQTLLHSKYQAAPPNENGHPEGCP
jgi:hypothetical protein